MTNAALQEQLVCEITLGDYRYPYYAGDDWLDEIGHTLGEWDADRFVVVSDDNVLALHSDPLLSSLREHAPTEVLSATPGEAMKSLTHLASHLERSLSDGATRRTVVVAFGGGVPGNLAGMMAAMLMRGIRLVHVPTTIVAAMDSVISLKQAINSSAGKNVIGCYHPPAAVFTDMRVLQTLSDRDLRSGYCEAAKNCLAITPDALAQLRPILARQDLRKPASLEWLLDHSLQAKLAVMRDDPTEKHAGLVLEYGHTVGHAIEVAEMTGQQLGAVSHGEAVAIGMVVAARVANDMGLCDPGTVSAHHEFCDLLDVRLDLLGRIAPADIRHILLGDNKRGHLRLQPNELAMVLLDGLGAPHGPATCPLTPVPVDEVVAKITESSFATDPDGTPSDVPS